MSALARSNGWRGFDGIGRKVDGGWEFDCDGMPTMMGCGASTIVTRRWVRVGTKSTGWLVCYGKDEDHRTDDADVVLTFCPECAAIVREQDANPIDQPTDSGACASP